ncbi:MAG: T9SS type A sorting domain-containing protein [Rhizobacter sp.]|nr:T9SS type A sorting domain-containing protein [Ferruginibacter sp.]
MNNPLPIRLLALLLLCACNVFSHPMDANSYQQPFTEIKMLSTFLYAANGNMADGNRVVFDTQYSNDVDRYDAVKMTNPGENFGLLRQGYTLAVEARQPIANGDTLHYKMSNLQQQVYNLSIQVQFLSGVNALAELVDRFTNTRHFVSLSNTTNIPVAVTADPASKAANRFYLVFTGFAAGGALPVKFTAFTAQRLADKSAALQWHTEEELNVDHYDIERSEDGVRFKTIGSVKSTADILLKKVYNYKDITAIAGSTFYRIRSVDKDGKYEWSRIAGLQSEGFTTSIAAYPNPVNIPRLNLRLTAAVAGNYTVAIINTNGQTLYTSSFVVRNAEHVQTVPVSTLINGHYIVRVTGEDGKPMLQSIVIKK